MPLVAGVGVRAFFGRTLLAPRPVLTREQVSNEPADPKFDHVMGTTGPPRPVVEAFEIAQESPLGLGNANHLKQSHRLMHQEPPHISPGSSVSRAHDRD
jgi:hypothetical protein